MGPLEIKFQLARSIEANDPYAVPAEREEYVLIAPDSSTETVMLDWRELHHELDKLPAGDCHPETLQRIGNKLRSFLTAADWGRHEADLLTAIQRGKPVHITICSAAAELYLLPWDLVTIKATGQHLGELDGVLIAYEWPGTTSSTLPAHVLSPQDTILMAWSAAGGQIPAQEHQAAIADACGGGLVDFDPAHHVLARLSSRRLAAALQQCSDRGQPVSILHILCHGRAYGNSYGMVWNSDGDDDGGALIAASDLRRILAPHGDQIRLIIVCACDSSNAGGPGTHLGSIAQAAHRMGIPQVIGSRHPLTQRGSVRFTQVFYQHLLRDRQAPERAFLATRRPLFLEAGHRDWTSMQLYARHEDRRARANIAPARASRANPWLFAGVTGAVILAVAVAMAMFMPWPGHATHTDIGSLVRMDGGPSVDVGPPVDASPAPPTETKTITITFRSKPDGAIVYVDGEELGRTPVEYTCPRLEGHLRVAVAKDGYERQTREVSCGRSGSTHFALTPKRRSQKKRSRPEPNPEPEKSTRSSRDWFIPESPDD